MMDTLVKKLYGRAAQGLPNQSDDERLMASAADAIEELREGVRALEKKYGEHCAGDPIESRQVYRELRALLGED